MRNSTFICLAIVGVLMGIVDAAAPYIAVKRVEPQSIVMDERVPPDKTMDEADDRVETAVYSNVSIIETRRKRRCGGCHSRRPDDYFSCYRLKDKHAKIQCKGKYGQDCTQACSLVYSVRGGGRYNHYKCRDGEWHPDFQPCSMELQCQLRLEGRGSIDCNSSMNHGPRCKISCDRKGRHPAVHNREVECNKQGRWSASLPHCVLPFRTNW